MPLVSSISGDSGHESDSPTSSSSRISSSSSSSTSDAEAELHALKRARQTEKARAQSLVSRALAKQNRLKCELPEHPADFYRPALVANSHYTKPGLSATDRRHRLRLLWSWFSSFVASIVRFVHGNEQNVNHIITMCVVDDTNMRLTPTPMCAGDKKTHSSRVVSCMNMLQTLLFNVKDEQSFQDDMGAPSANCAYKSFVVHTPIIPLERTNAKGLATEFLSWVFMWLGSIGERFVRVTDKAQAVDTSQIPIHCLAITWDSLKTNLAVLKGLRTAAFAKQKLESASTSDNVFPLLSARCGLHQIALSRKQLLFYFKNHWSAIVRLGHLFESQSFRLQFRNALLRVVGSNFDFISVSQLRKDHKLWSAERARAGLITDDPHYPITRIRTHGRLSKFDNGDPNAKKFTHWCLGGECICRGKPKVALVNMCQLYCDLFMSGFAVPLTYRWVHAHPALAFCEDTQQSWHLCLVEQGEAFIFILQQQIQSSYFEQTFWLNVATMFSLRFHCF